MTFYSQMKELDLTYNESINDDGAELLLECLNNLKMLLLSNCNISRKMETKLEDRGLEEGCDV